MLGGKRWIFAFTSRGSAGVSSWRGSLRASLGARRRTVARAGMVAGDVSNYAGIRGREWNASRRIQRRRQFFDPLTRQFQHGGIRNLPVAIFQLKLRKALATRSALRGLASVLMECPWRDKRSSTHSSQRPQRKKRGINEFRAELMARDRRGRKLMTEPLKKIGTGAFAILYAIWFTPAAQALFVRHDRAGCAATGVCVWRVRVPGARPSIDGGGEYRRSMSTALNANPVTS